jgi:putative transposase
MPPASSAVAAELLSTDRQFIDKVRDVVGLYMSPPENALVPSVEEKSPRPLTERVRLPVW